MPPATEEKSQPIARQTNCITANLASIGMNLCKGVDQSLTSLEIFNNNKLNNNNNNKQGRQSSLVVE
eukprot:scaffold24709_cov17-Tisochrysis_lutea.AAC.1